AKYRARHAVHAAEVAAVGDRDSQVTQWAIEKIDQTTRRGQARRAAFAASSCGSWCDRHRPPLSIGNGSTAYRERRTEISSTSIEKASSTPGRMPSAKAVVEGHSIASLGYSAVNRRMPPGTGSMTATTPLHELAADASLGPAAGWMRTDPGANTQVAASPVGTCSPRPTQRRPSAQRSAPSASATAAPR